MFEINIKNIKKGTGIFYVFLVLGILFFFGFGMVFVFTTIKSNSFDSEVMSTRVEVESHIDDEGTRMYSPSYYYIVNGVGYVCDSDFSSSINPGTENGLVYYDSSEPSNCITEYSKSQSGNMLIFMIIPIIFILVAVINIKNKNKKFKAKLESINKLKQNGKLIKNLPYKLVESGIVVNNVPLLRPVVDYTLPTGATVPLYGDVRYDKKYYDSDGMMDLLIDENDPTNYYMDFEINRIGGNLPEDYYQPNNQTNDLEQTNIDRNY